MICPYCSQWNPDSAPRCSFCDNQPGSGEDRTASGQPAYLRNTGMQVQLPKVQRSMFAEPQRGGELNLSEMWRKGGKDRALLVVGAVIAVVIVLGMVVHNC